MFRRIEITIRGEAVTGARARWSLTLAPMRSRLFGRAPAKRPMRHPHQTRLDRKRKALKAGGASAGRVQGGADRRALGVAVVMRQGSSSNGVYLRRALPDTFGRTLGELLKVLVSYSCHAAPVLGCLTVTTLRYSRFMRCRRCKGCELSFGLRAATSAVPRVDQRVCAPVGAPSS